MGVKRKGEKKESTINFTNLKEGEEYEARLVYVADLGLHKNEYLGVVKPDVQKIVLGYEILGEEVEIDGEKVPRLMWDKPFNIYNTLTDKGAELKHYKVFEPTAKVGEVPDWDKVLGSPVSITVDHVPDKKDPTIVYDNIASVTAIPKKYQKNIAAGKLEPAIADEYEIESDVMKSLFGLAKWMFDRRIGAEEVPVENTPEPADDDDLPF